MHMCIHVLIVFKVVYVTGNANGGQASGRMELQTQTVRKAAQRMSHSYRQRSKGDSDVF